MLRKYKSEFEELRSIGSGGFSTVFEARSIKDGKLYAIKKIPFVTEGEEKTLKEINILSNLNNDFVVCFIDSWIEKNYYVGSFDREKPQNISSDNLLYSPNNPLLLHLQMELCSLTLSDYIEQRNNLQPTKVNKKEYSSLCDIFSQLLECIKYLHECKPPIIHRDLKPENILLSDIEDRHKVKITDFGLSTYHEYVDQSHTKYIGTTLYRAPEIDRKHYNTKADIYSLGKIMEKLFKFDFFKETRDIDPDIQLLYKNAKQIYLQCVSYTPRQRPDCLQILREKIFWRYKTDVNKHLNKSFIKIMNDKWHDSIENKLSLLTNCSNIEFIDEIEEKFIFFTKDMKAYVLRTSDHIDSVNENPNIIEELSNQEIQCIVSGQSHVLCLTKEKQIYSFGNNKYCQSVSCTNFRSNKPKIIGELDDKQIVDIKSGSMHSLALSESGKLYAWGFGGHGQIGNGENQIQKTPIEIKSLNSEKIISLSCGFNHCLALSESGTLYGWGHNEFGHLGNGNNANQNLPIIIKFDTDIAIKKISAGREHSLVLTTDNDIYSFGGNFHGELGVENINYRSKPSKVNTSIKFIDIETTFYHNVSVGLSTDIKYYVWGNCGEQSICSPKLTNVSSFNEVFIDYSHNFKVFPNNFAEMTSSQQIKFLNRLKIFKTKIAHQMLSFNFVRINERKSILVTNDDIVYSFRLNKSIDSPTEFPAIVKELSNKKIKTVVCGLNHVLCLTSNYEVYSFGDNTYGQLGNGSMINNYIPTIITELIDEHIIAISCGAYHSVALNGFGKLFVWGYGYYGQIANNENYIQLTPLEVSSLDAKKIVSVSCGSCHCLALSSIGELYGWGDNGCGQLGVGHNQSENKPVLCDNQHNVIINKISCGSNHSLILTTDHTIYSFGQNNFGQLGNGCSINQNKMIKIETPIKFIDIFTTSCDDFSSGLSQTGKYYVWGKCGDQVITTPKQTEFTSLDEIKIKFRY